MNLSVRQSRLAFGILAALAAATPPLAAQPSWLRELLRNPPALEAPAPARALIVLNEAEVSIDRRGTAVSECRHVVKLLRRPVDAFAGIAVPFSRRVEVTNLEGWLVRASGDVKSLGDEGVADVGSQHEAVTYDDFQLRVARFADARPGDVVAFAYTVREDDWTSSYQSFVVQEEEPVAEARFAVRIPDGWKLNVATRNADSIESSVEGNRYSWTARSLPGRPEEPMMPDWPEVERRIIVSAYDPAGDGLQGFRDWASVALWGSRTEAAGNIPADPVRRKVMELTSACTDLDAKLNAVARFVRDDIRYVAVEMEKWRWEPRAADLTLRNRYGDCKDKTALMRAMLDALGVQTRAVLARAGSSLMEEVPSPFQFDHCIVAFDPGDTVLRRKYAPVSLGRWIICDPTDESIDLGYLPRRLHGSIVLVADSGGTVPQRLPDQMPAADMRRHTVDATLHPDGSVDADVRVTYFGRWAGYMRTRSGKVAVEKDEASWRLLLNASLRDPDISALRRSAGGDSVCWTFHCRVPAALIQAGSAQLLKADLMAPDGMPQLTAAERIHPVTLGAARREEDDITWHLPAGWKASGLPPASEARCAVARFSTSAEAGKGFVRYITVGEYTGGLVPARQYGDVKAFEMQLHSARTAALELTTH